MPGLYFCPKCVAPLREVTFDNLSQVAADFSLSPTEFGSLEQRLKQGLEIDVHACSSVGDPPGQGTDAIVLTRQRPQTQPATFSVGSPPSGSVHLFVISKKVIFEPCGECNPQLYDPCPNHSGSRRTAQTC